MQWNKPLLTLFGKNDKVSKGGEALWQRIPGAKGQKHVLLDAGHFVQEEVPEEVVLHIKQFIDDNPVPDSKRVKAPAKAGSVLKTRSRL